MAETQFTPGPWIWHTSNSWKRLKRDDRTSTNVLEPFVHWRDQHPDCTVDEADMALIAASPDLYDALLAAQEELRLIRMKDTAAVYNPTVRIQIELALAKAISKP